jgi:hypothetical protein
VGVLEMLTKRQEIVILARDLSANPQSLTQCHCVRINMDPFSVTSGTLTILDECLK